MSIFKSSWEYFGEHDPYYSVATFDRFKKDNLDETVREEFFKSGEEHVETIWTEMTAAFLRNFVPASGLDFGCGVGGIAMAKF